MIQKALQHNQQQLNNSKLHFRKQLAGVPQYSKQAGQKKSTMKPIPFSVRLFLIESTTRLFGRASLFRFGARGFP